MSDTSLLILFGSESGNAEDLASIAEKQAKTQGLSPTVKGMDEIEICLLYTSDAADEE